MIDHDYGDYYAVCDGCEAVTEDIYSSFNEVVDGLKDESWTTTKENGEWRHYCPTCAMRLRRPGAGEFAGI